MLRELYGLLWTTSTVQSCRFASIMLVPIYQCAMTVMFHDMLYDCLECYIDDVVRSKEVFQQIDNLRKVFTRCMQYNLRMNPLKCVFSVSFKEFLGFTVIGKGINPGLPQPRPSLRYGAYNDL